MVSVAPIIIIIIIIILMVVVLLLAKFSFFDSGVAMAKLI
jgi:hypothetical protein